ncbi:serine hydrolase [Coleofasciculus sp. FACHB-1120]|uniref:serine hydrolase n=1 Tax=Coleofasciculus sp. FACHB-1120 TaxID=2692783 RepID=UPI001682C649|nr:serine hydrolase [Coleofasciculus sp. FACHB-1120]
MGQQPQPKPNQRAQQIAKFKARRAARAHQVKRRVRRLRFAALAIASATIFTTCGLTLNRLVTRRPAVVSEQPSSILPVLPPWAKTPLLPLPSRLPGRDASQLVYNVKTPPNFKQSQDLEEIVDEAVKLATEKDLPTKPLSITLINVKTGEIAGYKQDTLRYPASVIKMFWMVALYAQIENGIWAEESVFSLYLSKMIKESDNEAASLILDLLTDTQSRPKIENDREFKTWLDKRQQVNQFFRGAGYKDINISQKTFPIPYLRLPRPLEIDLQMRGDPKEPIRNKITTDQAARLLYEMCGTGQAVSSGASEKMCGWLRRDLRPEMRTLESKTWGDFNPIQEFFGEALSDVDIDFYSKAGWTSFSRQEAAFVATRDGSTVYILTVFGDDAAYAKDKTIFPKMSRLVFDRMVARNSL